MHLIHNNKEEFISFFLQYIVLKEKGFDELDWDVPFVVP